MRSLGTADGGQGQRQRVGGLDLLGQRAGAGPSIPNLDVTVRGAISIARRLQDPLAELVKIDPKSIGVGQYQHDVNQAQLRKALDREVESCVNSVGVDVNTASAPLLALRLGHRPHAGRADRRAPRRERSVRRSQELWPRCRGWAARPSSRAAGFLRIRGGDQPLDNSAVHPESYFVVEKMAAPAELPTGAADRQRRRLPRKLDRRGVRRRQVGLPTVQRHPGRAGQAGPRPAQRVPRGPFRRRGPRAGGPARGHGAGRRGDQRHALRRVRRRGRPPGRADSHLASWTTVRRGPEPKSSPWATS